MSKMNIEADCLTQFDYSWNKKHCKLVYMNIVIDDALIVLSFTSKLNWIQWSCMLFQTPINFTSSKNSIRINYSCLSEYVVHCYCNVWLNSYSNEQVSEKSHVIKITCNPQNEREKKLSVHRMREKKLYGIDLIESLVTLTLEQTVGSIWQHHYAQTHC